MTPLHEAAKGGHVDTCEVLLEHGADVNAKSKDGNTPIDLAKGAKTRQLLESYAHK